MTEMSPRLIIYLAAKNYMDEQQIELFRLDLVKKKRLTDREFLELLYKYFDVENFRKGVYAWQEIWLYNYLKYEFKKGSRLSKRGLVQKYKDEILKPQEKAILNVLELL